MNRYHTSVKICYALGLHKQLLDPAIRKQIPASTSGYWLKTLQPQTIIGVQQAQTIQDHLSDIQATYHPVNTIPRAMFNAYCQFMVTVVQLLEPKVFRQALRRKKEAVINTLDQLTEFIPYQKAAALLGMTSKTLYQWRTQVKFKCDASALLLCARRHPNQATIPEVQVIRDYLSKSEYSHWSIHAIWAQAFKAGQTALSRHTWYRYNQILQFRTCFGKGKKPVKIPLRASRINQIWHADITVFKTLDGIKHYIYTVMDNYSRFIHAWRIETMVSAAIRTQTIRDAIASAFGDQPFGVLQLVTDGGPENDNQTLRSFLQSSHTNIHHTIALRDIVQSNSMQEAFYHTAKYRYLYRMEISNGEQLHTAFKELIREYHFERPHYALGIYTPAEVLNGADLSVSHKNIFIQAAIDRRAFNKKANCQQKCH